MKQLKWLLVTLIVALISVCLTPLLILMAYGELIEGIQEKVKEIEQNAKTCRRGIKENGS